MNWKDRHKDWEGNALELANSVQEISEELGIAEDQVTPSERLVRHYTQNGILQRPERRGKEAIFGFRQIVEFLAARSLIRDGWPVGKVAEFTRHSELPELLEILPKGEAPNRAQRLVEKFRADAPQFMAGLADVQTPKMRRSMSKRFAALTKSSVANRETLEELGNLAGVAERKTVVRLTMAPWCEVLVDPGAIRTVDAMTAKKLGKALTQILIEETVKKGEKQ